MKVARLLSLHSALPLLLCRGGIASAAPDGDVSAYVASQLPISIQGILNNIGAAGPKAPGVADGIVIASPSKSDPDYWYTWTRDAALTLKTVIDRFINGDGTLQTYIENYISAQADLQNLSNPSGGPDSGGLGEPKFHVNKTAFTGPWGRPQRDGPALRATALVTYARWLIDNGQTAKAKGTLWSIIAKDLTYVAHSWNLTGFDLWEEVNGSSFFTLSAQYRALVEGSNLAKSLGQQCSGCDDAAPQVLCFLDSFWTGKYIDSNINVNEGRTGLDANSILSSINTFDPNAGCTDTTFQPCSSRALANHKAVVDSFRSIYDINKASKPGQGVALGRYSEDVYFGGNPWYLTTFAAAEQLYDAVIQWLKSGSITITDLSLPFFKDIIPDITTGTYASSTSQFTSIIQKVNSYADSFLAVAQAYTPLSGALAEQFSRANGTPLSAVDLTWSYAAFVTVAERRNGVVPRYGWNEPSNNVPPKVCTAPPACTATVSFSVKAVTQPGENVLVVGSVPELGNWSPGSGVALGAGNYTPSNPVWEGSAKIVAGESRSIEYKYIRKSSTGVVSWESDPNRAFQAGVACGTTITLSDTWR